MTSLFGRSLHHAPAPTELLSELIHCLSPDSINLPSLDVSGFLKALRQSRVLLILDGWEVVLGGDRAGCYRPGYELYGELLQRIGEGRHQSCLVITSREKPEEVTVLEGCTPLVKSWKLAGLGISAHEILRTKGLVEEPTEWEQLIRLYRGNPLALNVVSTTIQEFFNSKVSDALKTTIIGIDPVNQAIAERARFLSELERQLLGCLAQDGNPMSIDTLRPHLPQASYSELVAALSSLDRRSLIEKEKCCDDGEVSFTLQPVVMKYFSRRSRTNA
ncbi:MAG: hypothetical protein HC866_03570 [Leptolyngbyaceae cyanobacterium RU_5_1]|nr:hypothetical protein [Leptolyngbyaceae cyanobacterium RU_5_1]